MLADEFALKKYGHLIEETVQLQAEGSSLFPDPHVWFWFACNLSCLALKR